MVADIGHRYISERAKGSALEHKKIGRLIANGSPAPPRRHHRSPSPPPIYGAFCTFDIFYCRSPLFVLFMFLLEGATLRRSPRARLRPAWPASTPKVPRPLSREIHPPLAGHWILRRICSWCKHAAILKRYISATLRRVGRAAASAVNIFYRAPYKYY